jgi:hypothetical protein
MSSVITILIGDLLDQVKKLLKNMTISSGLYEFCDYYIDRGFTGSGEEIIKEYDKFKDLHL